jgi:hypothetical protein
MSMTNEEDRRRNPDDRDQGRDKAKFADYIQLHTTEGKIITRADEKKILEEGLVRFGLDFREAQGILLSTATERKIALVSHAEHHIDIYLEEVGKRRKISRTNFNKAVSLYNRMTNDAIPETEIRARIKQMVEHRGWSGKRRRWLFGSRRWFKKA